MLDATIRLAIEKKPRLAELTLRDNHHVHHSRVIGIQIDRSLDAASAMCGSESITRNDDVGCEAIIDSNLREMDPLRMIEGERQARR